MELREKLAKAIWELTDDVTGWSWEVAGEAVYENLLAVADELIQQFFISDKQAREK